MATVSASLGTDNNDMTEEIAGAVAIRNPADVKKIDSAENLNILLNRLLPGLTYAAKSKNQ